MAGMLTNRGAKRLSNKSTDWVNDTVKLILMDSTFTPDQDDNTISDIVAHEIGNVSGYAGGFGNAGRKSLASKTLTENDTNNRVELDAADVTWTAVAAGDTIGHFVAVVLESVNDAGSDIIGYVQIAAVNTPTNGSDITITWDSAGLFNLNT